MPVNPIIEVFAHEYWLTAGIQKVSGKIITDRGTFDAGTCSHYIQKEDYSLTLDAAKAAVEVKRQARIASLEKSLAKVRNLKLKLPK